MRYVPEHIVERWTGRTKDHCVVIPVINEGERIGRLLARMSALNIADLADILIVDGGSTDGSLAPERLDQHRVVGLIRKTGSGKLSAQLLCAYAFALDHGYEGVVTIDGNDKDDPDAIPAFVQALERGYDFVQASRYVPGGIAENTPGLRDLAIRLVHAPALSWTSGFHWTDTTQGFRGYSRRLLANAEMSIFRPVFRDYELLAYMNYRAPRLGFQCVELPTARRYPKDQKAPTKIRPFHGELALLKTLARACLGRFDPVRPKAPFDSLAGARDWYAGWLRTAALPLWSTAGVDPENGGFREALTLEGRPHEPHRRTRSMARQVYVFATAAAEGFEGPWLEQAIRGFDFLVRNGRRRDGLFAYSLSPDGAGLDRTGHLYEQAFVMLAACALHRAQPAEARWPQAGHALRQAMDKLRHPAGGFREVGERPFQANAQMHVLEAALAWEAADGDPAWKALADEIARLALDRFIHPDSGMLREFFDETWSAVEGEDGLVEPGHQFEWAWLLEQWGRRRGDARARDAAKRLYAIGAAGVDGDREVAVNALWDDLSIRDAGARLWPQTERLKAALLLGAEADAFSAARGLAAYLRTPTPGLWRDKMQADGVFLEEPAPATSFYHILGAVLALRGVG
ncbi:AGE family epimerase/isomerase [Phenylobacterium sp. VNQ135]|uniref:AGE family epimerase/isomerase n=1 Tax=Phenylobacterium sp. VNQ135 TaxID=3400922 RepID=UPI003C02A022